MPAAAGSYEKKGHVCPPPTATHPRDRWETLFVYSFICKFTNLRSKVEGLENPMDLEDALMSEGPNDILSRILVCFVRNLRPQARNLSVDQISTTVAAIFADFLKGSERTIYWNEEEKRNIDPFMGLEGGFFSTDWDFKLKVLRQLVELQLVHSADIKGGLDRAWGVFHNKHKKKDTPDVKTPAADPKSQENIQFVPIGQDVQRKRYWVVDDSPRVFISTNPWKITATFQAASSTKEEYLSLIQTLKDSAPDEEKKSSKRTKLETSHLNLIATLEGRLEAIDAEIQRVARAKKKIEQRQLMMAQAEIRETRTRRKASKPDYVYNTEFDDDEEGGDDYVYRDEDAQEDEDFAEDDLLNFDDDTRRPRRTRVAPPDDRRRSARNSNRLNGNGKRESSADSWSQWKGERRSARLGAPGAEYETDPPLKRARTEDSDSGNSAEHGAANGKANGSKLKAGAAGLKPNEVALEQIAGKKRSRFWVYAVENVSGAETQDEFAEPSINGGHSTEASQLDEEESYGDSESRGPSPSSPDPVDHDMIVV